MCYDKGKRKGMRFAIPISEYFLRFAMHENLLRMKKGKST